MVTYNILSNLFYFIFDRKIKQFILYCMHVGCVSYVTKIRLAKHFDNNGIFILHLLFDVKNLGGC